MTWWLIAMKKYADFSGRARRTEYWTFTLNNIIFAVVATILDNIFGVTREGSSTGLFYTLFCLVILLPSLTVLVRRLHDVGKSGWWIFITLLPIIGGIWLFILTITDSQPEDNEFGTNPKLHSVV